MAAEQRWSETRRSTHIRGTRDSCGDWRRRRISGHVLLPLSTSLALDLVVLQPLLPRRLFSPARRPSKPPHRPKPSCAAPSTRYSRAPSTPGDAAVHADVDALRRLSDILATAFRSPGDFVFLEASSVAVLGSPTCTPTSLCSPPGVPSALLPIRPGTKGVRPRARVLSAGRTLVCLCMGTQRRRARTGRSRSSGVR